MSNHQWHQDQCIGEVAQRRLEADVRKAKACICDDLTKAWDFRERAALCDHLPACPQHFSKRNAP